MAKFRNKYRIESARLQGWDYRNPGAYFITICTQNRIHHFGKCENGKMTLSTIGLIVQGCWYEIPRLNRHVRLGEFIVMPNHIHGILILDAMDNESNGCDDDRQDDDRQDDDGRDDDGRDDDGRDDDGRDDDGRDDDGRDDDGRDDDGRDDDGRDDDGRDDDGRDDDGRDDDGRDDDGRDDDGRDDDGRDDDGRDDDGRDDDGRDDDGRDDDGRDDDGRDDDGRDDDGRDDDGRDDDGRDDVETLKFNVSTNTNTRSNKNKFFQKITPKSGSVSRILQQFKRACTYHIKCTFSDVNFEWQERFHDHIIRNDASFMRISNYILNNPLTWEEDVFSENEKI